MTAKDAETCTFMSPNGTLVDLTTTSPLICDMRPQIGIAAGQYLFRQHIDQESRYLLVDTTSREIQATALYDNDKDLNKLITQDGVLTLCEDRVMTYQRWDKTFHSFTLDFDGISTMCGGTYDGALFAYSQKNTGTLSIFDMQSARTVQKGVKWTGGIIADGSPSNTIISSHVYRSIVELYFMDTRSESITMFEAASSVWIDDGISLVTDICNPFTTAVDHTLMLDWIFIGQQWLAIRGLFDRRNGMQFHCKGPVDSELHRRAIYHN